MTESQVQKEEMTKKLLAEARACPECSFLVHNPFVERCPRCYSALPKVELDCRGCIHNLTCPAVR
jgi:uncharacterized OB-fold protein